MRSIPSSTPIHLGRLIHRAAAIFLSLTIVACGGGGDVPIASNANATKLAAASIASTVAASNVIVTGVTKLSETRVNRTVFDYVFRITVKNNGTVAQSGVTAILTKAGTGSTIVDDTVQVGSLAAGATITPTDTITIRQDRTVPFNAADFIWQVSSGVGVQLGTLKPAEVYVISLTELGIPTNADKVSVSGSVTDVLLKDGTLRFSTPSDTGADQYAEFIVTAGTSATTLLAVISSVRPDEVLTHIEAIEDGSTVATSPVLTISGLGQNNSFTGNTVKFRLAGVPALDLKDDSDGQIIATGNFKLSLKNYWVFNAVDSSFSISGNALQQLLDALPSGSLNVAVNFVSKDGEFASTYEFLAIKQSATLAGKFITPQGANVTVLSGKKVLLKGFNSNVRKVVPIDANGIFIFDGVIPDTYQLTLNDLENPNVVTASTLVFQGSTQVNVSIVYSLGLAPAATSLKSLKSLNSSSGQNSTVVNSVTQNGTPPPARTITPQAADAPKPSQKAALASNTLTATFLATAAAQNQTITTPIVFTVPAGTQNVAIKVSVYTQEYPTYTTAQSQFNDTWSYSVIGLPGTVLSDSGSVNQSHYTQGTITKTACVDVSSQAKNGDLSISGAVSATNIGDSALATSTSVEVTVPCIGLKVTSAKFSTPNSDSHPILQPIKVQGNLIGPYLSTALTSPDATHTIPLEIQFTPPDAKISEINIGVSPNGSNPAFATENLLGQANILTPGKIQLPRLSLPAFPSAKVGGKLNVTIRLRGSVNGVSVASDPNDGGQVSFNGDTAFTPLYRAGNEAALAGPGRRYGQPEDAGGDSWATFQTISWLGTNAFRFNDISAQHIAQTNTGRSVLGHSGHSDGQQLDLRYADGQGGYNDTLGGLGNGVSIKKLIDDASAEVAANAAQKPKLVSLQSWISANRAMLQAQASAANTRVIYIGHSFIKLALIDGKFSNAANATIPNVVAWVKPANVQIDPAHLSHWHISLTAHP